MSIPTPFTIEPDEVERLSDVALVSLLRRLLYLEAESNGIPRHHVDVPMQITVPDGGEDGSIRWVGGPPSTDWLPCRDVVFQCKATDMTEAGAGSELLNKKRDAVKPRVDAVLKRGGTYVLFYKFGLVGQSAQKRIDGMRAALREVGADYAETADLRVLEANKIAGWVSSYPSAVLYTRALLGVALPGPFKTWEQWSQAGDFNNSYFLNDRLRELAAAVVATLSLPRAEVRVEGQSGLGKTRFALEALRPRPADGGPDEAPPLSDAVIYADIADSEAAADDVRNAVTSFVNEGRRAVVVVDNCSPKAHQALAREATRKGSLVSLLTLDYDLDPGGMATKRVVLAPTDQEDIIPDIISDVCPGLPKAMVERAAEFASGFPQIAVLLGRSWQDDPDASGALQQQDLVNRLLFGRAQQNDEALRIARACSLFTVFGYEGEVAHHLDFIAGLVGCPRSRVYETCVDLEKRGIIEKGGRYLRLTPLPLALRLASDWWERIPPGDAAGFLEGAKGAGMDTSFCDQMEKLHSVPHSQEAVNHLCGPQGPFGNADVLSTEWGSRLLRSFASVNPQAVASALWRSFGGRTTEDLRQIEAGRRNLVWTLERLAFWEETFFDSARLLLYLGAAETETWSNNATGQFLQLFHIFLPGTLVPLRDRLRVLREGVSSNDPARQYLAVRGYGAALTTGHFGRSGGVERQGSRAPMEDYRPATYVEAWEYQGEALTALAEAACRGVSADVVRTEVGEKLGGILATGAYPRAIEAATRIVECTGLPWPEALDSTKWALQYRMKSAPPEARERVESFRDSLLPTRLEDRLSQYVSGFDRYSYDEDSVARAAKVQRRLHDLARETVECADDWPALLDVVSVGNQAHGVGFGRALFDEAEGAGKARDVAQAAFEALARAEPRQANVSVLAGVVSGLEKAGRAEVKQRLLESDALTPHFVQLLRVFGVLSEDLRSLVELARQGRMAPNDLLNLQWGCPGEGLTVSDVAAFERELGSVGGFGPVALELGSGWAECFPDGTDTSEIDSASTDLLVDPDFLPTLIKQGVVDTWRWRTRAEDLLRGGSAERLMEGLTNAVIGQYRNPDVALVPNDVDELLGTLLRDHTEVAWPKVGDAILNDPMLFFRLALSGGGVSFGTAFDADGGGHVLTSSVPENILLGWIREHGPEAAALIGKIAKAFTFGDPPQWTPLVRTIIDEFGDNKDVLSEIGSNLFGFGSVGSRAPYYRVRESLLRQLEDHVLIEVRVWARYEAERYKEYARQSDIEDEEEGLGVR